MHYLAYVSTAQTGRDKAKDGASDALNEVGNGNRKTSRSFSGWGCAADARARKSLSDPK